MFDVEKVMAFLKTNKGKWFTALDVRKASNTQGSVRGILPHLVDIKAVKVRKKEGQANRYTFIKDAEVVVACAACGELSEVRLMNKGHCEPCRRKRPRGTYAVRTIEEIRARDNKMRALLTMPFDATKQDVESLLQEHRK